MITPAYSDDELDEIFRGDGRNGAIGISAIDGLLAAIVAGPSFVHPNEWMEVIFGAHMPSFTAGSPGLTIVNTLVNSYNAVSATLSERPALYRPKFMNHEGQVIVRDWVAGFMRGVTLRRDEWSVILLTAHRLRLAPILVAYEGGPDLLPDISGDEKLRMRSVAHDHIADAVIAINTICAPHRAAESRGQTVVRARRRRRA